MDTFLLLGIIPGTNIQINFVNWLVGTIGLVLLALLYVTAKRRLATKILVLLALRRAISRTRLDAGRRQAAWALALTDRP